MGKQLEVGTQFPMRPATASLEIEGNTTISSTQDFTNANTIIPVDISSKLMDDKSYITASAGVLTLRAGVWKVEMALYVDNDNASVERLNVAVTNSDGTTIYGDATSDLLSVPASAERHPVYFPVIFHLTEDSVVHLRAYSSTGSNLSLNNTDTAAIVTKIGNKNES